MENIFFLVFKFQKRIYSNGFIFKNTREVETRKQKILDTDVKCVTLRTAVLMRERRQLKALLYWSPSVAATQKPSVLEGCVFAAGRSNTITAQTACLSLSHVHASTIIFFPESHKHDIWWSNMKQSLEVWLDTLFSFSFMYFTQTIINHMF